MLTRSVFALVAVLGFALAVRSADLPPGTWAVNVDGQKGDLVVTQVKDGKVTGSLLGTDFAGTWDGKALTFPSGKDTYEAHLVTEPGEKGKVKYTLTGLRSQQVFNPNRAGIGPPIHVAKVGWYAQLTADAPAPTGFIRAEVRGVLVVDKRNAYVSVKREVGGAVEETRVALSANGWKEVPANLAELDGKQVIVSGDLAQRGTNSREEGAPRVTLHFRGKFDIKPATDPK